MTAYPVQGQMASFSTRKKIERNNMSLLDHNLQIRVVGKTHQSPPPRAFMLSLCSIFSFNFKMSSWSSGGRTSHQLSILKIWVSWTQMRYFVQATSFSTALFLQRVWGGTLSKNATWD